MSDGVIRSFVVGPGRAEVVALVGGGIVATPEDNRFILLLNGAQFSLDARAMASLLEIIERAELQGVSGTGHVTRRDGEGAANG